MIERLSAAVGSALAVLLGAGHVGAADIEIAEGKLTVNGSAYYGTAVRTAGQDCQLLADANASLVGSRGCGASASSGKNQDDGNLNFKRGDFVANVFKGYLSFDYRWRDYGIIASGKAWYDWTVANASQPWGNIPNDFTPGRLGDSGAIARSKFSGVVSDNVNVYGTNRFRGTEIAWKIGYQKLDWGNRYIVIGGLRDLTPLDIPGALRPGRVRDDETRVAIPMIFARVKPSPRWTIEGFWQFQFHRNVPNQCGTLFSRQDFVSEGCDKVFLGPGSDRQSLETGNYIKRAPTPDPTDVNQGGVAVRYKHEPWSTEFGAYAVSFHSRRVFYSAINTQRTGDIPYIPGDPGGLNPRYFTEFPESIQMYALTFDKAWRGGAVFGEFAWRPNQPLQYNAADLIAAFGSNVAPTPLRDQVEAVPAGGVFHAWERHHLVQLQLGAFQNVPSVLKADFLNLRAEFIWKNVPDLPDLSVARFGRSDVFGQGPIDGVCPPPQDPVQCSLDGYVSKNALGFRLRAALLYRSVLQGLDLLPSVFFGHDIMGWSGDGAILQGRYVARVELEATIMKNRKVGIAWQPTWGGAYNNLRDRGIALAWAGYVF